MTRLLLSAMLAATLCGGCTSVNQALLDQAQDYNRTVVPVLLDQYAASNPTPRTPAQIQNMNAAVAEHGEALARYEGIASTQP